MDPLAPIVGVSIEQFAELSAELVDHPDDLEHAAPLLARTNVSPEAWASACAGWKARLEDISLGGAVAVRFVPVYQAALTRLKGPPPPVPFDDFVGLSAEVMHTGLPAMLARRGLDAVRWSQIAFYWNAVIAHEPARFAPFVSMVERELLRLLAGGAPRAVPSLPLRAPAPEPILEEITPETAEPDAAIAATAFAAPEQPASLPPPARVSAPPPLESVPAPAAVPAPAPAPAAVPAPAPVPAAVPAAVQPQPSGQDFDKKAEHALHAVGGAIASGFNALGSALDSFLAKPTVGGHVLVQWSDGNRYPGTVAQLGQGQHLVTMADGRAIWVPEAFLTIA